MASTSQPQLLLVLALLGPFVHLNAQDTDVCVDGWEAVAREHLLCRSEGKWEEAAAHVVLDERTIWQEWQEWSEVKLQKNLAAMSEELQERHDKQVQRDRARLEVSVMTCAAGVDGDYRIRVDPNGRSFQFLTMRHDEDQGWQVATRMVALDLEQEQTLTFYLQAVDDRKWEEAEAWVAQVSRPRFAGYRTEVEMFLSANEILTNNRKKEAALRKEEWPQSQWRAERLADNMLEVHVEFPSAPPLACEMVEVDGIWRILHR